MVPAGPAAFRWALSQERPLFGHLMPARISDRTARVAIIAMGFPGPRLALARISHTNPIVTPDKRV